MQLVIDIGNSNVVCGIYAQGTWLHNWRWETILNEQFNFFYQKRFIHFLLENKIDLPRIEAITISSVVPQINDAFSNMMEELFSKKPNFILHDSYPHLSILTDNPDEMGTDLIANAVAAVDRLKDNTVVVDFGTALTFTAVTKDLEILGVAIAPGLSTALKSLHIGTAQLPEVTAALPHSVIGKNTTEAIQSGVFRGYIGLVLEIVRAIDEERGVRFKRIATGGLSGVLHPLNEEFDVVDKNLTLNGIRLIGEAMRS